MKKQAVNRNCKGPATSLSAAASNSDSSNNSSSSVNKDWENWIAVHGKATEVAADVRNIGKAIGVKYKCDTTNSFNLLTREGRKEWRASGVSDVERGVEGGSGKGV